MTVFRDNAVHFFLVVFQIEKYSCGLFDALFHFQQSRVFENVCSEHTGSSNSISLSKKARCLIRYPMVRGSISSFSQFCNMPKNQHHEMIQRHTVTSYLLHPSALQWILESQMQTVPRLFDI